MGSESENVQRPPPPTGSFRKITGEAGDSGTQGGIGGMGGGVPKPLPPAMHQFKPLVIPPSAETQPFAASSTSSSSLTSSGLSRPPPPVSAFQPVQR
jgi:hypothetical protein